MESKLKLYSLGIVAKSKELNSDIISVTPYEHIPIVDGDINSDVQNISDSGVDANGNAYQVKGESSNTIKAYWRPIGATNRETAPDVVVGNEVVIYRYENSDKYYWETRGRGIKRLETVIERYSNTRDPSVKELDDDNSYFVKVSTHEKIIIIKTNDNDGEKAAFAFYLNGKEGVAGIVDDDGNIIQIDKPNTIITLKNKDESFVEINKTNISGYAKDSINLKTKNLNIDAETITTNAKRHNENIDSIFTKGQTFNIDVSSMSVKASTMTVQASFSLNGALAHTGSFESSGGSFTHNGLNVGSTHKHAGGTINGETLFPLPS